MSSHIDCDDLLALATCSVEDQFNSDIKNQLSMSLLRHIAQASGSAHTGSPTHPYGFSNNHRMFAPATTPTTSSYTRPTSTWMDLSMEEANTFSAHHHDPRGGRIGLSRSAQYHEEEDDMETDGAPSTFSVILPEGASASGNTSGTRHPFDVPSPPNHFSQAQQQTSSTFSPFHPTTTTTTTTYQPSLVVEPSSPPSLFATADPFFLAVSELQSVAVCRRQLQPKTFAAATPLQVTPNPVQFGALAPSVGAASANGMFMRREGQQFDAAMLQYR